MSPVFIGIVLSFIMAADVTKNTFSEEESNLFSSTPKNMTPVEQDYSPGLGDRGDAVSYTISFGMIEKAHEFPLIQTYEGALKIQEMVYNISNGVHQMPYTIGQDKLRWGTAPYLYEDTAYPMGDGTPGSGYAKYRKYVEDSFKNNADVAQIIEPLLAGRWRDDYAPSEEDIIPLSCYTHDENGEKKIGWSAGEEGWHLLSLYNLYETGYAQKAWKRMQDTWNFRTHLYYDAMIPVPEGFYNNPNLSKKYGGILTNTEMEWDAVQWETKYSWENYAISSAQEHIHPKYKGLSCAFSIPYGPVSDEDFIDTWMNSVIIGTRGSEPRNLVWGAELGDWDYAIPSQDENDPKWNEFVKRLMKYNLQYLYMMNHRPLSFINNDDIYQVVFSGDLISTYDKKTENYTLIEKGDFIIADGGDRFIPQVGAGCKIYVYSRDGKTRTWKLPDTWAVVTEIDMYKLTVSSAPIKLDTLTAADGNVTITMDAGVPYLIVPKGNNPTPKTANFNDLTPGTTVGEYQGLKFDLPDNPEFYVYGANARGGFASPSIFAEYTGTSKTMQIGLEEGNILHSMKIGNKGGVGKVVLHSSNPLNPDVMIELPKTDEVYKFNTDWVYGETGPVTVKVENDKSVSYVLFDAIMYS